jgi:hypothetical protein
MAAMIATKSPRSYLAGVPWMRLLRLLTIVALLLAPLTMVSEHAAMAMPAPVAADAETHHMGSAGQSEHCAGMAERSDDDTAPQSDCMTDCAIACSAIPPLRSEMAAHDPIVALVEPLPLVAGIDGLHPESDPPPPRAA